MSGRVCIGFDLDETLGNVYPFYPFIAIFRPSAVGIEPPESLKDQLRSAYEHFVMYCVQQEEGGLGILRPGILDFLRNVRVKQAEGSVGPVIIYSNNSCLEILEFARDIVHQSVGEVFCALIDRNHSIRRLPGHPNPPKTWDTLVKIFRMDDCSHNLQEEIPMPETSLFFDDLVHPDLQANLKENYIHVRGYKKHIPDEIKYGLYFDAANQAGLFENREYVDYLKTICKETGHKLVEFLLQKNTSKNIRINSSNINSSNMVVALNRLVNLAGGRRTRKLRRRHRTRRNRQIKSYRSR
jgi:hypothetical protein